MKQQVEQRQNRRKSALVKVGIIVSAIAGWLWSGTSLALVITILQITHAGGCSRSPALNKDGSLIAFLSDGDLTGSNTDENDEVFVWRRATGGFTQVTNSTDCCNGAPVISAKNDRVAFESNLDLLVGHNADGGDEVFLWDSKTGLKQLTNDPSGNCCIRSLTITGGGKRLAFESNLDLVGRNGDGNEEIFLWTDKTGLSQLTDTTSPEGNISPAISSDAIRIAFVSNADFVGENADGSEEIFLWEDQRGFTQMTNTTGKENLLPAINAEGRRVAFVSNADFVEGNADGNQEIFLWDEKAGFTQLTNTLSGQTTGPAINAFGDRVAFVSDANLLGSNTDGNQEIFLWDSDTGLSQITYTAGSEGGSINNFEPTIDKDGDIIAFTVERTGFPSEASSREIFVATIAKK